METHDMGHSLLEESTGPGIKLCILFPSPLWTEIDDFSGAAHGYIEDSVLQVSSHEEIHCPVIGLLPGSCGDGDVLGRFRLVYKFCRSGPVLYRRMHQVALAGCAIAGEIFVKGQCG